jgi:multidrug resistance efflux pump
MGDGYKGEIKARVIEVRFFGSGKVVKVNRHKNEKVSKGELIAALDRKSLQTELEIQLTDYDRVRADWDNFTQKNPGEPADDLKFTKQQKQATLNSSVKQVELAKMRLDQCDLFSPVAGIIIDDGGIIEGQNITPSAYAIKIVDTNSYYFEFEIEQKDISKFSGEMKGKITIEGIDGEIDATTNGVFADGKKFYVSAKLDNPQNVLVGMMGEIKI